MQRHWYRVEMTSGIENFYMWGSSSLDEDALMAKMNDGAFVMLDDLIYFDEEGNAKGWSEGDPQCKPRVHLNSRFLISLMPLIGDPRKMAASDANPKVLSLPRVLRDD